MGLMIVDTGCANLNSVRFAFERLGVKSEVSADPERLRHAGRLVLPGVGAARAGMRALRKNGLAAMLRAYQRPLLGICLGMQLLFERSAEGDCEGLGLLGGAISALPHGGGPIPHMGWNQLEQIKDDSLTKGLGEGAYVYFVHSYAALETQGALAQCTYGAPFAAMVRKDNIVACQFHPERSGKTGAQILQNFVDDKT